ncbi:AzlD domain-containing protein [Ructibacterium gallinarum]|uniref:AzlD domain-containing protein n=1 Tax=Ructibacterium gallinarum TaxID=2779355 RepID=A0A9D5M1Y7_9FIRM|nr:AzlD domain-containing protein [Ructibacterium gallinarum]MBE5039953.1 AzlD domain-containing protein [Ructibacterium gallinarum]
MDWIQMTCYIAVMALVTYAVRCLPLTLFRREITNVYIRSFLEYIPYAVLGTMTLPDVLYSTGSMGSAVVGLIAAAALAYMERSLLTVAAAACLVVFVAERIL